VTDHDFAGFSASVCEEVIGEGEVVVVAHGRVRIDWNFSLGNVWIWWQIGDMRIKMSWARQALVIAGVLAASDGIGYAGDFIRVKESEGEAKLQTAIFGYEKDGVRVDLIGAIHLGDRRYYKYLNEVFKRYEVLLFEMVGGEHLGGKGKKEILVEGNEEEEAEKDGDNLEGLRKLYAGMEKALGLVGQGDVIDYHAENFVHADLTMAEFNALQKERGESLIGFMFKAGMAAEKPTRDPDTMRLLRGLLGGRPDLVKLEVMHTMADGDEQVDAIAGDSVIIAERNAKCIEVLDKELEGGKKKVGIFYGAAHFPDLERRLVEKGYERVSSKWITAWAVRKVE
jgi:hypothetical protein